MPGKQSRNLPVDKRYALSYTKKVKYYAWDERKNSWLREARGVSFEAVVVAIHEGALLAIINHPNQRQYPGQKMFIVELFEYAYVIPFVEDEEKVFLKTIFPSRKYTKQFIEKGGI